VLRQDELAFIKATLQLSPALLKELRLAVSEEEPGGAWWEPQQPIWKRGQSLATACGQAKSQEADKLGRHDGGRH